MGLSEKRAIKDFQDKVFPGLKKQVDQAAGFDVKMDVQWDTLAVADMSHLYKDSFTKVYFTPLIDALKSICSDDMGKEGLQKQLKKVVISNTKGVYYGDRFTFEDGVLLLDHEPCTNVDHLDERRDGIKTVLEKSL